MASLVVGNGTSYVGDGVSFLRGTNAVTTTVTPDTLPLILTSYAPSLVLQTTVTPSTASLTLTAYAPSIVRQDVLTPSTVSLSLTAYAPNVTVGTTVTPDTANLVLMAYAPLFVYGVSGTISSSSSLTAIGVTVRFNAGDRSNDFSYRRYVVWPVEAAIRSQSRLWANPRVPFRFSVEDIRLEAVSVCRGRAKMIAPAQAKVMMSSNIAQITTTNLPHEYVRMGILDEDDAMVLAETKDFQREVKVIHAKPDYARNR